MNGETYRQGQIELRFTARFTGRLSIDRFLKRELDGYESESASSRSLAREVAYDNETDFEFSQRGVDELIEHLNHSRIEEEIQERLRDRLRLDRLEIDARIHFSRGSIEWDGVLYVLNWLAAAGGTIGLAEFLRKMIIAVIDAAIKKRLPKILKHEDFRTTAFIEEEVVSPEFPLAIRRQMALSAPFSSEAPFRSSTNPSEPPAPQYKAPTVLLAVSLLNSAFIGALAIILILLLTTSKL